MSRVAKSKPGMERLRNAQKARTKAYAKRLAERLAGMSKGDIWRLAYTRGWQAAWLKYGKGQVVPKRPAHEHLEEVA